MSNRAEHLRNLRIEALLWLLLIASMWAYTYAFDEFIPNYRFGAVAWPRAILIAIAICVAGWYMTEAPRRRGAAALEPAAQCDLGGGRLQLAAIFLIPLAYTWLLPRMGFLVVTPFFVAAYMYAFGQRRWRHLLGTSLAIYVVLVLVFVKLLFLALPVGVWPGFYEINNALLRGP